MINSSNIEFKLIFFCLFKINKSFSMLKLLLWLCLLKLKLIKIRFRRRFVPFYFWNIFKFLILMNFFCFCLWLAFDRCFEMFWVLVAKLYKQKFWEILSLPSKLSRKFPFRRWYTAGNSCRATATALLNTVENR